MNEFYVHIHQQPQAEKKYSNTFTNTKPHAALINGQQGSSTELLKRETPSWQWEYNFSEFIETSSSNLVDINPGLIWHLDSVFNIFGRVYDSMIVFYMMSCVPELRICQSSCVVN